MAQQRSSQSNVDLAQQIGRMAAVLDRIPEDRKEFLGQIDKLDTSITSMTGMISEMRSAFAGVIRRTETLEKDGDRCEKLEGVVTEHDARLQALEYWRTNRRRANAMIASSLGALGGAVASSLLPLIVHWLTGH